MENNELGKLLKIKRKEMDLSLKDVENMIGVSASYINRLEVGNRLNPSAYVIKKLCDLYNISVSSIINFSNGNPKSVISDNPINDMIIQDKEITILFKCILDRITTILMYENRNKIKSKEGNI